MIEQYRFIDILNQLYTRKVNYTLLDNETEPLYTEDELDGPHDLPEEQKKYYENLIQEAEKRQELARLQVNNPEFHIRPKQPAILEAEPVVSAPSEATDVGKDELWPVE